MIPTEENKQIRITQEEVTAVIHGRAAGKLKAEISKARKDIREAAVRIKLIKDACEAREWHRLTGILSDFQIQFLSENSPHDLLEREL